MNKEIKLNLNKLFWYVLSCEINNDAAKYYTCPLTISVSHCPGINHTAGYFSQSVTSHKGAFTIFFNSLNDIFHTSSPCLKN